MIIPQAHRDMLVSVLQAHIQPQSYSDWAASQGVAPAQASAHRCMPCHPARYTPRDCSYILNSPVIYRLLVLLICLFLTKTCFFLANPWLTCIEASKACHKRKNTGACHFIKFSGQPRAILLIMFSTWRARGPAAMRCGALHASACAPPRMLAP